MMALHYPMFITLACISNAVVAFTVGPVGLESNQAFGTNLHSRKLSDENTPILPSPQDRSRSIDSILDSLEKIKDAEKLEEALNKLVEENHLGRRRAMKAGKNLNQKPQTEAENRGLLSRIIIYYIQRGVRHIISGEKIAHVIRFIFHECVGGCDGCLNRDLPPNMTPMLETVTLLDQLYDSRFYRRFVSRADFYVLAAITTLDIGVSNANQGCPANGRQCIDRPRIPFRFGRKDCATSPISAESRTFPKGRDDFDAVMAFFASEFGLGPRLGTALSGAHTLGGAAGAAGSGFLGFWKENATEAAKFDARYFSLMADPDLNWNLVNAALQTNANSPRWQWEGFRDNEQGSELLQF